MKKVLSLIVVLALICSVALAAAFAEGDSAVVAPSVEMKGYPEPCGGDGVLVIKDKYGVEEDGSVVVYAVPDEEIKFVPAGAFDEAAKAAYKELDAAKSITDACANAADVIAQLDANIDSDKLVIRDLFEIKLFGEAKRILEDEDDHVLMLEFNYAIKEGDFFMPLTYVDGAWTALDPILYSSHDGYVSLALPAVGVQAFVVAV